MSFQQTIYSTPNFQINSSQRQLVAPWAVSNHYPKTIQLGASSATLTPEQTISGAFYVQPATQTAITVTLPDATSWFRFLSTRSVPGYENISNNDMFVYEVILGGTGTSVNFAPGTGASGIVHSFSKSLTGAGATGAQCYCLPVSWTVTSTGVAYNVL